MRWIYRLLIGVVLLGVVAAAGLAWLLRQHPPVEPWADLAWDQPAPPMPLRDGAVSVTWLGVATLLIDDGHTAILTDGFFSRPDKMQTFFGKVEPDLALIDQGMRRSGLDRMGTRLAAVIPVHSHYDHAMDAPVVARRTGALLLGSASTAQIGRGWGLEERQIRVARLGETFSFGAFRVSLLAGRHAPTGFTGGEVTLPLKPPARATDYKEGQSYAIVVEHSGRRMLIMGSAGFEPGALKDVRADVVLLGIGSLGPRDDAYRQAYWREAVHGVGARRVIPIHWDDFWIAPDPPFKPMPPPLDRFDVSMAFLREQAKREGVQLRMPLQCKPMDVWAGLPPAR